MKEIEVSVIIPIRNEEKYIEKCIQSLLRQDYDKEHIEYIFVDGESQDKTQEIINRYIKEHSGLIKLMINKNKTVPYAMNIGIKESKGKYIVRLDAHSEYEEDYIKQCKYYLDTTDADNVGGAAKTASRGYVGNAIAMALSCVFGVGNSSFRTDGESGEVDTVPFGAFRRDTFEKYGYYDERLVRNQDIELNHRIRKNGGKIYLSQDIKLTYFCRDSIKGIGKQSLDNGLWNIITYYLCPGSLSIRHFVPLCFVLSILGFSILGIVVNNPLLNLMFLIELILYLTLDIIFSLKISCKKGMKYFPILVFIFPYIHIMYGLGSLKGLFVFNKIKR